MYPWKSGNFPGSGQGDVCLEQAGMHVEAQLEAIQRFIEGKYSIQKKRDNT
jgi:hypothetical protein